jgi:hypothetical protein
LVRRLRRRTQTAKIGGQAKIPSPQTFFLFARPAFARFAGEPPLKIKLFSAPDLIYLGISFPNFVLLFRYLLDDIELR